MDAMRPYNVFGFCLCSVNSSIVPCASDPKMDYVQKKSGATRTIVWKKPSVDRAKDLGWGVASMFLWTPWVTGHGSVRCLCRTVHHNHDTDIAESGRLLHVL